MDKHVPIYMFLLLTFTLFIGWVTTHSNKCVILLSDEKITIVSDRWGTLIELAVGEERVYAQKGPEAKLHPNTDSSHTQSIQMSTATFYLTSGKMAPPATTATWVTIQRMLDVLSLTDKIEAGSHIAPIGYVALSKRHHRVRRIEVSGDRVFFLNNIEFSADVTLVHKGGDSRVFIHQLWNPPRDINLVLSKDGNPLFSIQEEYWDHEDNLRTYLDYSIASK